MNPAPLSLSVIEVIFEDGSSDPIHLCPDHGRGVKLPGWMQRRDGRRKNTRAYSMSAVATYLCQLAAACAGGGGMMVKGEAET